MLKHKKKNDNSIRFKIKDINGNEISEDFDNKENEVETDCDEDEDEENKLTELESLILNNDANRENMLDNLYKDTQFTLAKKAKNIIRKYEKNVDKNKTNLNNKHDKKNS